MTNQMDPKGEANCHLCPHKAHGSLQGWVSSHLPPTTCSSCSTPVRTQGFLLSPETLLQALTKEGALVPNTKDHVGCHAGSVWNCPLLLGGVLGKWVSINPSFPGPYLGCLLNVLSIYKTVWGWLGMGSKKALHTPQFSAFSHRGKEPKLGSPKIHPFLQPGYFEASVVASQFWNMSPLG